MNPCHIWYRLATSHQIPYIVANAVAFALPPSTMSEALKIRKAQSRFALPSSTSLGNVRALQSRRITITTAH